MASSAPRFGVTRMTPSVCITDHQYRRAAAEQHAAADICREFGLTPKHWNIRPRTGLGQASTGFLATAALAFLTMNIVVATGQTGGNTFSDNWWIAGPAFVAFTSLLAAALTGSFALIRRGERSPLVHLAVLIGALVGLLVAGEAIAPH